MEVRGWNTLKSYTRYKTDHRRVHVAASRARGVGGRNHPSITRSVIRTPSGTRTPARIHLLPDPFPFLYLVLVPIRGYSRFSSSEHHVGPKMPIDCGAAAFVIRLGWI